MGGHILHVNSSGEGDDDVDRIREGSGAGVGDHEFVDVIVDSSVFP